MLPGFTACSVGMNTICSRQTRIPVSTARSGLLCSTRLPVLASACKLFQSSADQTGLSRVLQGPGTHLSLPGAVTLDHPAYDVGTNLSCLRSEPLWNRQHAVVSEIS